MAPVLVRQFFIKERIKKQVHNYKNRKLISKGESFRVFQRIGNYFSGRFGHWMIGNDLPI